MPTTIETTGKYFDYNALTDKSLRAYLRGEETAIRAANRRMQSDLIEVGQRLIAAKERAGHGLFMEWAQGALGYSHRHILGFMHVAQTFGKMEFSSNLPLSQTAIFALASPSVSDDIRAAAIDAVEAGEIKTTADAKAFITEAKAPAHAQNGQLNGHAPEYFEDAEADEELEDDEEEEGGITAEEISEGYTVPAVKQPKAQRSDPAPVTAAVIDEDDLTDEEYLLRCPAYRRLMQFPHKGREFKANALAYRAMSESVPGKTTLLGQVKHAVSRSFEVAATGPFYGLAVRFANTRPPQEWPLCVKCQGKLVVFADTGDHTGHGPEIVCKGCTGGYTL